MAMTIVLENIPVYLWTTRIWNETETEVIDAWLYNCENGYQSIPYLTLAEVIVEAKTEIKDLIEEFGTLVVDETDNSWIQYDEEF